MISLQKNKIAYSVALFILAFAAITLVPTQVFTMDRYLTNIIFLSTILLTLIIAFKKEFANLIQNTRKYELFFLVALSLLVHLIVCYFVLNFLNQPVLPFDSRGASFLLMNNFYIWAKPLEILAQQLLIILLVTKLSQSGMGLKKIILLFVFGFGAIHIFQIFKTDLIVGLGFTFFAILASFLFPYMILKVRNGYIYNFIIHLVIYDVVALLSWSLY